MQDKPTRTRRLDLPISPGKSLGWLALGTSVTDIIATLREKQRTIPSVELKYSPDDPLHIDLLLRLPANGLNLRFDAASQRLKSIECFDLSKIKLTYQGGEVSSNKTIPTFVLVYKSFGPTYPGEMDSTRGIYTLNYPGLSFVFPIPTKQIQVYATSSDLPMEFSDGTTPVASHVYIFQGSQDWRSAVVPSLTKVLAETGETGSTWEARQEAEAVIADPTKGITIQFPPVSKSTTAHVPVLLHVTTPQDLVADLGKPSRIFYKEEDKLRIHSVANGGGAPHSSSPAHAEHRKFSDDDEEGESREVGAAENGAAERVENEVPDSSRATDFFYNYFHLGIDVLFDGTLQTCKKIVLHGNVPGHFDFQRYKRCPFRLIFPVSPNDTVSEMLGQDQDPSEPASPDHSFDTEDGQARGAGDVVTVTVTADMKMSVIQRLIPWLSHGASGAAPQRPVIFTRGSSGQNPFGPSVLRGYDEGVVFEVMRNDCIATVVLF